VRISMLLRRAEAARNRGPRLGRYYFMACTLSAMLLCACSASAPSEPPLISHTAQKALSVCLPVPDKSTGLANFNSAVGIAEGLFYNQSAESLTVESVTLFHPHNLVLHAAIVYKMAHYSNPLYPITAWNDEGKGVPENAWNMRQPVPGAVIPSGDGVLASSDFPVKRPDVYEIALEVSASSPAGGWALGEVVKYRSGNKSYNFTLMTGMAIGGALQPSANPCSAPLKAINAAFAAS
jgi:hypothetical protein